MIEVRIERLVLTGFSGDPGQLREAVQAELTRQLADLPRRGSRRCRVVAQELPAGPLAEAIACSIHRGIREVAG